MHDTTAPCEGKAYSLIPLSGSRGAGKFTKVSTHRYKQLSQYRWFLACNRGYVARRGAIDGKQTLIYLHREVACFPVGKDVDHINGDHLDNRDENLRPAARSENNCNARKLREHKSSKYKGVCWCKNKSRWMAQIQVNNRHLVVGYYSSEDDAARARDGAVIALHGSFAVRSAPHLEPIPYVEPVPLVKTSNHPGVGWSKSKQKWRAFTTHQGKFKHLGYFESEDKAYECYRSFSQG